MPGRYLIPLDFMDCVLFWNLKPEVNIENIENDLVFVEFDYCRD